MKRKYVLIPVLASLMLTVISIALVPSPPVNQNIGIYDTLFSSYNETKCRGCHASGVPTAHHTLAMSGQYGCTDCHPQLPDGSGVTMVRDCLQCHNNTFNGMKIRKPHHETQDASAGHCSRCHGNLVDDFDDGHYIPTSNPSTMTPDTKFKAINLTSGKKWGGCESCHDKDFTANPIIAANNQTHHRLGNLSGFQNNDITACQRCHDVHGSTNGADFIRYCEKCHGTNSLHNIQYDIANTSSIPGYGHLGTNDCQGCHASYVAGVTAEFENIVPTIESISQNQVLDGDYTQISIRGDDFVTTYNGVTHSSIVVISEGIDGTNLTNITPDIITHNDIEITIPPLKKGIYGIYALKDGMKSNKRPIMSKPKVIIDSVIKNGTDILISGSGFSTYDPLYANWTNVTITNGGLVRTVQMINWSDTSISITSPDSVSGDLATVNSVYGTNSSVIG